MAIMSTSYAWFNGGGGPQTPTTAAPTAQQAFYFNQLNVLINGADADTTCTITHNLNLTAAQQTNLLPNISDIPDPTSLGTVRAVLLYTVATNTITVLKANTVAGSGGTYRVTINRPLSVNL